jgi:hypothetical protein
MYLLTRGGAGGVAAGDARANLYEVLPPSGNVPDNWRVTLVVPGDVAASLEVPAGEADFEMVFVVVPRVAVEDMRRERDSLIVDVYGGVPS